MAQRSVPAPFLTKTYQLVDDEGSDDVVSWSESGTTFVVWKTAEFAKDMLPNYFKHNNFSSFVRQLNTYGFRKTVPDKWEFANEYFRKGQQELLSKIRRRKTALSSPRAPHNGKTMGSPSNSGEDVGSTFTSSHEEPKSPHTAETVPVQVVELSGENEKLKRDNEILSSELAQTRKQCEELVAFLTECVKIQPDQINRIMRKGSCGSAGHTGSVHEETIHNDNNNNDNVDKDKDDDDNGVVEGGEKEEEKRLKLFGVWLKGEKKRGREEKLGCAGPHSKEMKKMAPWMRMKTAAPPGGESSKVCN